MDDGALIDRSLIVAANPANMHAQVAYLPKRTLFRWSDEGMTNQDYFNLDHVVVVEWSGGSAHELSVTLIDGRSLRTQRPGLIERFWDQWNRA